MNQQQRMVLFVLLTVKPKFNLETYLSIGMILEKRIESYVKLKLGGKTEARMQTSYVI